MIYLGRIGTDKAAEALHIFLGSGHIECTIGVAKIILSVNNEKGVLIFHRNGVREKEKRNTYQQHKA
jgi:hypothetical protein